MKEFSLLHLDLEEATDAVDEVIFHPAVDVYRVPSGWIVKFDLAGVNPEEISVKTCGSCLTIDGVRKDWLVREGCAHYSMEISYNRFMREVMLPCELEGVPFQSEYRNGMLLVHFKVEESKRGIR